MNYQPPSIKNIILFYKNNSLPQIPTYFYFKLKNTQPLYQSLNNQFNNYNFKIGIDLMKKCDIEFEFYIRLFNENDEDFFVKLGDVNFTILNEIFDNIEEKIIDEEIGIMR